MSGMIYIFQNQTSPPINHLAPFKFQVQKYLSIRVIIGGDFSVMEGRHFSIGDDKPVIEGELALSVALLVKSELERKVLKLINQIL
jgi:hypothetical protein